MSLGILGVVHTAINRKNLMITKSRTAQTKLIFSLTECLLTKAIYNLVYIKVFELVGKSGHLHSVTGS